MMLSYTNELSKTMTIFLHDPFMMDSIYCRFTLGCMLNCFLWLVTGIFEMKDFNIILPNFLGLLSAIAQFALKVFYGNGLATTTPGHLPL